MWTAIPDHSTGALITLFGTIFSLAWGWVIKQNHQRNTLLASHQKVLTQGYHELIEDMKVMLEAARAEVTQAEHRCEERCEKQLMSLEMDMYEDIRERDKRCQENIKILEDKLTEVTLELLRKVRAQERAEAKE